MCVCVFSHSPLLKTGFFFFLKEAARIQALFVSKFLFSFDQSLLGSGSGGDIEGEGRSKRENMPSQRSLESKGYSVRSYRTRKKWGLGTYWL